jgi:hypothetical protein
LIEYKDERCEDLRLRLFRGPLDLDTFPVLKRRSIRVTSCAIDASIIGASHAVQFKVGDEILTEVLACGPDAVRQHENQLVGVWRLGDVVAPERLNALSYSFATEFVSLEDAAGPLSSLRNAAAEAEGAGNIGLAFLFPSVNDLPAAETILCVDASSAAVSVRSAHVYPAEHIAVFSRSQIALPKSLRRAASQPELVKVGT